MILDIARKRFNNSPNAGIKFLNEHKYFDGGGTAVEVMILDTPKLSLNQSIACAIVLSFQIDPFASYVLSFLSPATNSSCFMCY